MSGAATRFVVTGFEPSEIDAIRRAMAENGVAILDQVSERAMLVTGEAASIAALGRQAPHIKIAPERVYRLGGDGEPSADV